MSQAWNSFVCFIICFLPYDCWNIRFSLIACFVLIIFTISGFSKMCLRDTLEGVNIPVSVPSEHKEISCLQKRLKTKQPQFHLQRIDVVRLCACSVTPSCPTLCNPMDCSLPGASIHGILHARRLEWVSVSYSIERLSEILFCFVKGKKKSCPFTGRGGERCLLIAVVFGTLWCWLVLSLAGMELKKHSGPFLVSTFYWTQTF